MLAFQRLTIRWCLIPKRYRFGWLDPPSGKNPQQEAQGCPPNCCDCSNHIDPAFWAIFFGGDHGRELRKKSGQDGLYIKEWKGFGREMELLWLPTDYTHEDALELAKEASGFGITKKGPPLNVRLAIRFLSLESVVTAFANWFYRFDGPVEVVRHYRWVPMELWQFLPRLPLFANTGLCWSFYLRKPLSISRAKTQCFEPYRETAIMASWDSHVAISCRECKHVSRFGMPPQEG